MTVSFGTGLTLSVLSLVFNGSFSSLNKIPRVVKSKVDPIIFNLYFSVGVILSSIIVYIVVLAMGSHVTFTYLGVVSGILLAMAGLFTFATISKIGLSIGVGLWSGTAVVTSFIEGIIVEDNPNHWSYAIIGAVVLIIGILGTAFSTIIADYLCIRGTTTDPPLSASASESTPILSPDNQQSSLQGAVFHSLTTSNDAPPKHTTAVIDVPTEDTTLPSVEGTDATQWLFGILYSIIAGICGGSVALPTIWTDSSNSGARFLISFAVGVVLIFPITFVYSCLFKTAAVKWELSHCFIPGLMAGIVWNGGNLCSIYAIDSLSYAVAYPIMQSSLIVAAIWGVFVWKEITDYRVIGTLFSFCLVVIVGCALIAYGVDG